MNSANPAELEDSVFLRHEPCENCGSSDGKGIYDDGHTYCFVCKDYKLPEDAAPREPSTGVSKGLQIQRGEVEPLPHRKISQDTCKKFGYEILWTEHGKYEIANYRDKDNKIVAQKFRGDDKAFHIRGDAKAMTLFGSHMWSKGKRLVITEGEIDAMSVSQIQNNKWATVSLPNGAQSATKALKNNWQYLEGFEQIVLMFDMDEPGQTAAQACAELLPVGKARIAYLPCKDANECLQRGMKEELISAIFEARVHRPDGIVEARDLKESILEEDAASDVTYPYPQLNEITRGLRKGELVTITAGSGIGKTTMVSEIAVHLHKSDVKLGMIMLEESTKQTLRNLVGIHINKNITVDRSGIDSEEISTGFDELFDDKPIYLYDHFGSTDVDVVCSRIMYMAKALGVEYVILDHISILVSGLATNDERKLIDTALTKLRTLVQEVNIGLILVSHLRRPEGDKGHEDGAKVRLGQLRGSHSIAQLSDMCLSLQVDPEDPDSNRRQLFLLKNRFTGQTGFAGSVEYDQKTGRLLPYISAF